jgi:hypothetical protein
MPTDAMPLLRQEPSVPGDLHALFSNVTVALRQQMKFFPCNSLQTQKYFPARRQIFPAMPHREFSHQAIDYAA